MSLNEFFIWLNLGFEHILDWKGYDHMLFLWMSFLALGFQKLRSIVWRVSLFTIAHSITLILSVYGLIPRNTHYIEIGIVLSIILSAIVQISRIKNAIPLNSSSLIFVFGLIHGMGFSTLLISLLGDAESHVFPLLGFNVGLELGQLLFLAVIISIQEYLLRYHRERIDIYRNLSAFTGVAIGLFLLFQRF